MPGLLTLKTDLKSLKYGHDTPGGGDSNQPYITTDINTVDIKSPLDDGFIRGGIVGAVKAAATDTLRIGKFFLDVPKGPLFIARQIGLQLSNPRLEVPKNPLNIAAGGLDNLLAVGTKGLLEPTRIYNLGINTIAQVPVNAFGAHFNRHGILPVQDKDSKYEAIVTANNNLPLSNDPSKNNRLVSLAKTFELGDRKTNSTQNRQFQQVLNLANTAANFASAIFGGGIQIPSISINPDQLIIDKYFGGPGSVYGIGNTIINRASYTEDGFLLDKAIKSSQIHAGKTRNATTGDTEEVNYTSGLGKGSNAIFNYSTDIPTTLQEIEAGITNYSTIDPAHDWKSPTAKTYNSIKTQIETQAYINNQYKEYKSGSKVIGYANQFGIYDSQHTDPKTINKNSNYSNTSQDYIVYKNTYDEVVKIKTTGPNGSWNSTARENRVGSGRKDEINLTPIFNITGSGPYWGEDKVTIDKKEHNIRDLVKFRIQAISTDDPENSSSFMVFRAYLTSFSDSVNATWNDIKYAGRGDKLYVYDSFTRKISIGFKVAALSAAEMKPMYQKLNYLMSNLMPDYRNRLMRGPLVRMTVGNYFDGQLGKLDSLSYTIPNDSPWEIALDEPEAGGTRQLILPHIIEVTLEFTPIGAETGFGENNFSVEYGKTVSGSVHNELPQKAQNFSNLAQNTTGDVSQLQYIE